jgi:4-oxalocrotonate tautomerase
MPTVDIQLVAGRSLDEKRKLVREVTNAIAIALAVQKDVVKITIHEVGDDQIARGGVLRIDRT